MWFLNLQKYFFDETDRIGEHLYFVWGNIPGLFTANHEGFICRHP